MEFVLKALEGIFSIVFIIGIGFVLSRRGWFDEYSSALIARLVTAVSLPLYMIVSISKNFDHNKLVAMAPDLLLPICSMLLAFIVGKLAARIFKIKKERRGIFCTNFFYCQYHVYWLAGQSGVVRREKHPCGHALLYGQYNIFLDFRCT